LLQTAQEKCGGGLSQLRQDRHGGELEQGDEPNQEAQLVV